MMMLALITDRWDGLGWKRRARVAGGLGRASVVVLLALGARAGWGVSCTTQSQMAPEAKAELAGAATRLAGYVVAGDTGSLRAATLPSVAGQFEGIAGTVEAIAPGLKGSGVEVKNLYLLHAEDLKAGDEEAQFFCSVPGAPLLVTVTIPQLPAGTYALAVVHAAGGTKPEQMGMILSGGAAKAGVAGMSADGSGGPGSASAAGAGPSGWQLAGFFARPLTIGGHDGVWYWSQARELAKSRQRWSAYYYYQSAQFLLTPVDFIASPNLAKLEGEAAAVRPEELAGMATSAGSMTVTAGEQSFSVTSIGTDGALGGLDLVMHYNANAGNVDPVFARAQAVALMQAMLKQHAELRANFHGLWVYADSPGRQPFAVELPMGQIE